MNLFSALVACGVLLWAAPAMAHKIEIYAEVEGTTISGMVYFHGGSPAQGAKVEALAPDGRKLGETTTDAKGEFTLAAKYRCDHRLVVNAGGGHGGEGKVGADDLPKGLPPYGAEEPAPAEPSSPKAGPTAETKPAAETTPAPAEVAPVSPEEARLQRLIEAAVREQLRPLQRKLAEYQEKIRLSDVLGGIGYILGITGMLFFFLGARRKKSGPPAP